MKKLTTLLLLTLSIVGCKDKPKPTAIIQTQNSFIAESGDTIVVTIKRIAPKHVVVDSRINWVQDSSTKRAYRKLENAFRNVK